MSCSCLPLLPGALPQLVSSPVQALVCNELLQIKCRGLCSEGLKCADSVGREQLLLKVCTFANLSAHV
jgi:hypothetical protein